MFTDREISLSHAVDDAERERTRLLRAARQAITMLDDALHALHHNSPHVTSEFLERTLELLQNETYSD